MGQTPSRSSPAPEDRRRNRSSWLPRPLTSSSGTEPSPEPQPLARHDTPTFSPAADFSAAAQDAGTSSSFTNLTRRSRLSLSRARTTLTTSIPNLLTRTTSTRSRPRTDASTPSSRFSLMSRPPPRHSSSDGPSFHLPTLQVPELDINFEDPIPDPEPIIRPSPRRDRSSSIFPDRILSRPDRGIRNMTSSLRRRRSPITRGEDQAAMLSRLLSVAAAATAATLMGEDHRAVSEARNVAGDDEDGTFDSFLQALQNGRIASALRQSGSEAEDGPDAPEGTAAPLNFFRMFRFGTSSNNRQEGAPGGSDSRSSGEGGQSGRQDGEGETNDGRMVPIIIVGIRSITPSTGNTQDDTIPPFLDALSSIPTPFASTNDTTIDGILRQPQNGTRFSHRRRASMGGLSTFPSNYDSQRHHRSPDRPRPWSTFSDTLSGPRPPPSTPASQGLSAFSTGNTTPTVTTTPSSPLVQSAVPSRRASFIRRPTGDLDTTGEEPPTQPRTARQRRLSESDFTRFGSGAPRRNGVVEPDHNPGEGSRSWIIYVLGGSYPENHPILTTPSLFTDSPTYEDMLLLSALLGPAKPPVASEADVASAPGLFRIVGTATELVARAVEGEGEEIVALTAEQRCLVCLCEFEIEEEARRLVKCGHLFHRECIDQWLTTGRNSCPLCRGQGVDEKEKTADTPSTTEESTTPPSPTPVA
ncbi:hypothetical protein H2201_000230 [Coniosporium apollinis]|uniref:RING-type domain-containing protein n=1 Tax=Coniosporium apollinis TaxID=61459 RepID=A0ABQ9P8F0_9PEZI|nr:hypothetical protein H2201_000230 [Coniosporium apollinis]